MLGQRWRLSAEYHLFDSVWAALLVSPSFERCMDLVMWLLHVQVQCH